MNRRNLDTLPPKDPLDVDPPGPPRFDSAANAWILSSYEDVTTALRDERLVGGVTGTWSEEYRQAAVAAFSGQKLSDWRWSMQSNAATICEHLATLDSFDLVRDFAAPWSDAVATIVTGESRPVARSCARAIFAAAAEPFDESLVDLRNMATVQLAAEFGGSWAPLWVQAFVALSQSLPAFLGNACHALIKRGLMGHTPAAVEELLRYASPAKAQFRKASAPVRIGTASIEKNDHVVLMICSANRDPEVFIDPETLNLARTPNRHFAFGAGEHSCLGAALIRMAAGIALCELFGKLPAITVHSCTVRHGFALRAIESLPASTSKLPHPLRR